MKAEEARALLKAARSRHDISAVANKLIKEMRTAATNGQNGISVTERFDSKPPDMFHDAVIAYFEELGYTAFVQKIDSTTYVYNLNCE